MPRSPIRFLLAVLVAPITSLLAQGKPTIEQFMSPPSPLEITTAKKTERIAWMVYDRGMRNVYTAAAPDFRAVRLTSFLQDNGIDVTDVALSDDGTVAVFVRGSTPNGDGWIANPSHDPNGPDRAIWAVRTVGGAAPVRVATGSAAEVSPDGRFVLYVRDGQIYRGRTTPSAQPDSMDRGLKPFISAWGRNSSPRWSPDGSKIAFVTDRSSHAFIAMYDVRSRKVDFVAPNVDRDGSPMWAADGKRIFFTRRPGAAFGQQDSPGSGAGLPAAGGRGAGGGGGRGRGAAAAAGAATEPPNPCAVGRGGGGRGAGGGGRGTPPDATGAAVVPPPGAAAAGAAGAAGAGAGRAGRGGRGGRAAGGGAAAATDSTAPQGPTARDIAGLCNATFRGGYSAAIMVADLSNMSEAKEVWHNQPNDPQLGNLPALRLAGDHVLFTLTQGNDEFERWFSLKLDGSNGRPVLLTPTNGLIEDNTSISVSADGKTFYYCTNAEDIERRHIWAVPVAGGTPVKLSQGDGIETSPSPMASGKRIAVLYFNWNRPASVAIVPAEGGAPKVIYPTLGAGFPTAAHVKPEIVITKAPDGTEVHNQLFLPKDLRPGERRPAMVFVHGGPQRQMLPGYHYMQFYHWAYGINQWLASQGYVVMSINYRRGIGYGRAFRNAPRAGGQGNSEYQDVLAGGQYLQSRADVDPTRVGIWGLSYGGVLTAQALSRNSDIFVAGADLAGVHLWGSSLDVNSTSFQSSAIAEIDKWKSPVFLVHGDDDRNVNFGQTVGLVQLLRQRNIYYELEVVPDDLHESMLHSKWLGTWSRMGVFLKRFVWDRESAPALK